MESLVAADGNSSMVQFPKEKPKARGEMAQTIDGPLWYNPPTKEPEPTVDELLATDDTELIAEFHRAGIYLPDEARRSVTTRIGSYTGR